MKGAILAVTLVALTGCEYADPSNPNQHVVDLSKCNCEIVSKDELAKLREQAKHHYVLRNEGVRAWRFDESTGQICLLLAPAPNGGHWSANDLTQMCPDGGN